MRWRERYKTATPNEGKLNVKKLWKLLKASFRETSQNFHKQPEALAKDTRKTNHYGKKEGAYKINI